MGSKQQLIQKIVVLNSLSDEDQNRALLEFSTLIWENYPTFKREFAWRETNDPYKILVSEIMLQQTQVERVTPKYEAFITRWPTLSSLAKASLSEILQVWKGLGYNRRALALATISKRSEEFGYTLINDKEWLLSLPMVGKATYAALSAFAFNQESLYLETNIRRVLIYHFYPNEEGVHDKVLYQQLQRLLHFQSNYREWYYALMDWGVALRSQIPNPNRRSAHYTLQSRFEGSHREVRSKLLFLIQHHKKITKKEILKTLPYEKERVEKSLYELEKEGFLLKVGDSNPLYSIEEESF